MNIAIVSQLFYPEEFKINDLVEELVNRGHNVTVLTGKPNYPSGNYAEGYRFWGIKKENYKGASVIRVPLLRRKAGGSLRLMLNYFSFVFFACWYIAFHKIKADYVLCFEVSPVTQMFPALFIKKKNKCKAGMWVQDLWPESVAAASSLKSRKIMTILDKMVKYLYSHTDHLFIQSKGFSKSILEKGNFEDKIVYVPNWAENMYLDKGYVDGDKYENLMPKGFRIMFAGNIGAAQDFDNLIEAVNLTKSHPEIKWIVVGDGRKRKDAENKLEEYGLYETLFLLGRYPSSEMPHFFEKADAMLVTLKDEYIFSLTIPSKIQTYMAFGKPILTMANGVTNDIVSEADCGFTASASDYQNLAANAIQLSKKSQSELSHMCKNAEAYYRENFDRERVVNIIENKFSDGRD